MLFFNCRIQFYVTSARNKQKRHMCNNNPFLTRSTKLINKNITYTYMHLSLTSSSQQQLGISGKNILIFLHHHHHHHYDERRRRRLYLRNLRQYIRRFSVFLGYVAGFADLSKICGNRRRRKTIKRRQWTRRFL